MTFQNTDWTLKALRHSFHFIQVTISVILFIENGRYMQHLNISIPPFTHVFNCSSFTSQMCSNSEVSYKKLYPTFIRTFAIDTKLTPSLLSLLKYFNWKRVAIIYENVTKWIEMKNNMVKRLRAKGITVSQELLSHPSALYRPPNHTDFFRDIFRKIKQEARSMF